MIKAQELRIGNWVLLGKNYQPVYQILYDIGKGHSINHMDYEEELFQPIPLTTEILKKEFTADNYGVFYKKLNKDNHLWIKKFMGSWQICVGQELDNLRQITSIKYLHQLQNLYFALTNSELEINLNQ